MHSPRVSPTRRCVLASLAALASPAPAIAQSLPSAPASEDSITADLLKTGLYLLRGGGCQSLLRLNAAGCVLVDGKRAGTYRPLMSLVRRINKLSDLPLRGVIYTNHHDIHAGNHAQFLAGGASVLVQSNCLPRLPRVPSPDGEVASGPRSRRPLGVVGAFTRDHQFTMGGVEIRLYHFGAAKTDNDAVVLFPDLRLIAAGELFSLGLPVPDYAAGGTLLGWRASLDRLLDLGFDTAVPSGDALGTIAQLRDFRYRMGVFVERAARLVKNNIPKSAFATQMHTDDLGWQLNMREQEVDLLYRELGQMR
jgi:glyoxylase-like metal-dependent hydrolase (beta-lactamase superfamily II)